MRPAVRADRAVRGSAHPVTGVSAGSPSALRRTKTSAASPAIRPTAPPSKAARAMSSLVRDTGGSGSKNVNIVLPSPLRYVTLVPGLPVVGSVTGSLMVWAIPTGCDLVLKIWGEPNPKAVASTTPMAAPRTPDPMMTSCWRATLIPGTVRLRLDCVNGTKYPRRMWTASCSAIPPRAASGPGRPGAVVMATVQV